MTESPKTLLNATNIQMVASTLLKSVENRTDDENNQLIGTLEGLEYFRNHISDPSERKEFIRSASRYFEYSFYSKGAAICHQGDLPPDFAIILSGSTLVFEPKTKDEFDAEVYRSARTECLDIYKQYARANGVFKKFRRLQSLSPARQLEKSLSKTREFSNYDLENSKLEDGQENPVEEILKHPNSIIPYSLSKYDLTFEEKFLFLINGEGIKNYFKDGKSTHKKRREVKAGMSVVDIALTTSLPCEYTISALEDLHLITIKKESFMLLYKDKFSQYQKKRKFLSAVFPSLPYDAILRLSAYVQEKVYHNWEYVYQEGVKSDGIFIVKTGEVQLLKYDEEDKKEKNLSGSLVLKDKSKTRFLSKQKLNATKLNVGGVFGEEEIIKRTTRRYSAKCNGSFTLLYVLSSQIYTEIIEKHFPEISEVLKVAMHPKSQHRNERIQKGQKIAAELIQQEEVLTKQEANNPSDLAAEKIPEEFSKKRGLFIDLSHNESAVCEERISRMTKKKVEIKIRKGNEIKPSSSLTVPKGDEKKSLSKSPKNELYFSSGPEDLENMKSKLFKKYQKGPSSKNHLRKSSYYFPEDSKAKTFRPSTAAQNKAKPAIKASNKINKTDKSESRIAFSLVLDGYSEEIVPLVKNVSSYFQSTTQTPKKPNLVALSSYSFSDIFRRSPIGSLENSHIALTPKQSQVHSQIRAFNLNDHPVSSFNPKTLKKPKLPIMEEFPKESSLFSIPTLNFEQADSMADIGGLVKPERVMPTAVSTRSFSESNKIFIFNKGQGETKMTVVKSQTPKSMILDGNYNHIRKNSSKTVVDRITFRKCSIET